MKTEECVYCLAERPTDQSKRCSACDELPPSEGKAAMQWHVVEVPILPKCDFCKTAVNARFDGKMNDMRGMWANFCDSHWYELGVGETGIGMGQRLVVK